MDEKRVITALAGNPNVGKSTIFNGLTGMRQHTGNWAGKTVSTASGVFRAEGQDFLLIDLPGTYSLTARSPEEKIARDFINSGLAQVIIVVCDATCLERGLHLLDQIIRLDRVRDHGTPIVLCINLCDEAAKKGISIDFSLLRDVLQIPVCPTCARSKHNLEELACTVCEIQDDHFHYDCLEFSPKKLAEEAVTYTRPDYRKQEEFLDRLATGKLTGPLIMLLLLTAAFWLSMVGAGYPSNILFSCLFFAEKKLAILLENLGCSPVLIQALVYGVYRVLAWVVSVMLPPMAIFFPLFTLLEDFGYLPRAAFNMDHAFQKCRACGKQCLTMTMGLGCNAAGVTGCRIIDSPRERLIAIITNAFIPCNGRLPTLFTMISLFFLLSGFHGSSLASALGLTAAILAGILMTLMMSWLLSHTLLKGIPSSFTLELPPYRRPQFGKVILRSIFDRTLFVLGRAVLVAAPAGLLIWILANISYTGPSGGWFAIANTDYPSLLSLLTGALDPLGHLMGLDGVILAAFLLGFPANEIVLPIILMAYLQTGMLTETGTIASLSSIFSAHGWTAVTPVCLMIFCLFHWPCSTTCLTIYKETGSLKWTAVSILLPTITGMLLCILVSSTAALLF